MLLGDDRTPSSRELNHYADVGVRAFLAAYATAAAPDQTKAGPARKVV